VWIQPAKIPGRKAGQSSNAKIERWERELKIIIKKKLK